MSKAYLDVIIAEQRKVVLFLKLANGKRMRFEGVEEYPSQHLAEQAASDIRGQL